MIVLVSALGGLGAGAAFLGVVTLWDWLDVVPPAPWWRGPGTDSRPRWRDEITETPPPPPPPPR